MESTNHPHLPHKSSSFAVSRDEKPRDIDRNFSLGIIKLNQIHEKKERHGEGGTIQEEAEENENTTKQEETNNATDAEPNLASVFYDIDKFLSILHSLEGGEMPEIPESTIDKFVSLVETEIENYESGVAKWSADDDEGLMFLRAVEKVSKLTCALTSFASRERYNQAMNRCGDVLHQAMCFLEDEFHALIQETRPKPELASCSTKVKRQSSFNRLHEAEHGAAESNSGESPPPYPPEIIQKMNLITGAMISGRYTGECRQLFVIARRNAFEAGLPGLGYDKVSIEDVMKMSWETLEGEVVSWIKAFKHTANVSLPAEHDLCEAVFAGHRKEAVAIFRNLARCAILQLLTFAEAVSMTKRSAEKLFKVLDIYEALRDAAPRVGALLPDVEPKQEESSVIADPKVDIAAVRCRLGEAAVAIFCELETAIKADSSKTQVPGGGVHPLTRYVMNYLKYACEYRNTLEQVFKEHKHSEESSSDSNPFAAQLLEAMNLLESNLEAKSHLYKDQALCNIFLMNNGRYIAKKVKGSTDIHQLLGETWYRRRSSDLRQYHKNYQRETWSKVLSCLRDEGLQAKAGSIAKPVLKERFKSFNAMIEEINKTQSTWVVSDEQMKSELRVSVSAVVVPAYRSFLGRFAQYLYPGRQTEKYIKFGADDLENLIDGLFEGNPSAAPSKRR